MKNKFFISIVFVLFYSVLQANTCSTATAISIKSNQQPDTFQISSTEMWFTFTGSDTATFYINNYINGTFAGINQVDLYSGSCSNLVSRVSFPTQDTLIMFKYIFIAGNQYYLKLTRPSGLSTYNFSVYGSTWVKQPINPCTLGPCEHILNPPFFLNPNMDYSHFWDYPPNQFHDYYICGWQDAWGTPNIVGANPNYMAFIWSTDNTGGEAIVTDMSSLPLIQNNSYTLHFDYLVSTGTGVINFVFSSLTYATFPLLDNTSLYSGSPYVYAHTVVNSGWQHVDALITMPAGTYLTMVVDPQSSNGTPLRITIDNISIGTLTAITIPTDASCGNCDGSIDLTTYGDNPAFTYNWTGPNNFTATTQDISGLCLGTYYVTVTDAVGCTWTGSQFVNGIFTGANWPIDFVNTAGDEEVQDMVTDNLGNVYAIGTFTDNITLGSYNFTKSGSCTYGIFVVKLNYCGVVQQARYYGNVLEPNLHIERIAKNGLIVIAGEFCGTIDFTGSGNPMTAVDNNDGFFAALDPNTLYCNANQQVHIYSNSTDIVNGISVNGLSAYVAGGFQGTQFNFSNSTVTLSNPTPSYYEMFLCQFNCNTSTTSLAWANSYSLWASTWHDIGMTMQYISPYIYFTYQHSTSSTVRISNLGRVSATNGSGLLTQQIGSGSQFINVYDMAPGSNGYLYLCGYLKSSFTASTKKATVFYYPAPNTSIVLDPNNVRLASTATTNNEATKLVVNGSNVFVSGSYDYTGFQICDPAGFCSLTATLYGTIDHFVYKTNATLIPNNGWLSGVASTTTNVSKGNTLAYDGTNNVYYLGGTFNGNLKFTGVLGQTISPYAGYDGYIGRFVDNGLAEFKRLSFFNDTTSKILNSNISVYPNPAYDNIIISSLKQENISEFSITDLSGRRIINTVISSPSNEIKADISTLAVGTYFVNVSTPNNNYNIKLVIVK